MKTLYFAAVAVTILLLSGYVHPVERMEDVGTNVAGSINGESFSQRDLDLYAADLRSVVAAWYSREYDLSGVGADFWNASYGGTMPRELVDRLALNNLAREMVLVQEARSRGIDTPREWNDLAEERAVRNTPTDAIVYGPKTLAPAEYNSYRITGIEEDLKTTLLHSELAPTEEQLRAAFESLPSEYKIAPYTASGIRFSWNESSIPDGEMRADIESSIRQGLSPEEIVDALNGLRAEQFNISSRYISKTDEHEQELSAVLRETPEGSFAVGPGDRSELYYVNEKSGGGYYSFEQARGLGRNKWITDQFEKFLDEKVDRAKVEIFAGMTTARPIDLSRYTSVSEARGDGTLTSRGKATAPGATTYYIDYNNGSDANSGTSPLDAWKTFKNVNLKRFNPGDHILLEANSIWNGTPADKENYIAQAEQRGNGGMLAPLGSGAKGNPCVIDLYEIRETGNGVTVFWSADQRPIINGNGTPSLDSSAPYSMSGTVHFEGQDYWEIRNVELTNSYDFPAIAANPSLLQTHWYKLEVPKSLSAMIFNPTPSHSQCKGIVIEDCYIHDVQTRHKPRGVTFTYFYPSEHFGTVAPRPSSDGGAIYGCFSETRVEGNIIRRVAPIGFHSRQRPQGKNLILRGNYFEAIGGDAIIVGQFEGESLVESNLVKDACAAPNYGESCYAAAWTYGSHRVLFQYNEAWGTLYGWWDGEAWDVDNDCDQIIYQYNYSHHNTGGAILFMDVQTNSIFRYNVSANDGGGSKYMEKIVSPGALPIDRNAKPYEYWDTGQSLIHHAMANNASDSRIPLVYNNTFYLGDGVSAAIFGFVWDTWPDPRVRFYNNVVIKNGAGEVRFADMHGPMVTTPVVKSILDPTGFKNNLLYAYRTDREKPDKTIFKTGNITMDQWTGEYGNIWADPKLKIQEPGADAVFREQRDDCFPEVDGADPAKLREYVSVNRLRKKADLFTPMAGSPVLEAGMRIPVRVTVPELDGAWNGNYGDISDHPVNWDHRSGLTRDMFGNPVDPAKPPIGAASGSYRPFTPGEVWEDNNGVHINAHGGGILFDQGKYWWFGEHKTSGERGNVANVGVHCYSSSDLIDWHDEGIVLAVDPEGSGSDIEKGCILERPKVIRNPSTGKYVMWFHLEPKDRGYEAAMSGVAVSDNVTGPYKFIRAVRPNAGHWPLNTPEKLKSAPVPSRGQRYGGGSLPDHPDILNIVGRDMKGGQMARDMNLFVDDDGKAYHIYSSEDNSTLHIALLTDDYTEHSGIYTRNFVGRFMEAPAMFKHDGKYYLMMSGCTGWEPNEARSAVSDSILGEWRELGNPCIGDNLKTTFDSQSTFILPVHGTTDKFIYLGDRWRPRDAIDGRYIWLPVHFDGDRFTLEWKDTWTF